jgi:hypothetical protein
MGKCTPIVASLASRLVKSLQRKCGTKTPATDFGNETRFAGPANRLGAAPRPRRFQQLKRS